MDDSGLCLNPNFTDKASENITDKIVKSSIDTADIFVKTGTGIGEAIYVANVGTKLATASRIGMGLGVFAAVASIADVAASWTFGNPKNKEARENIIKLNSILFDIEDIRKSL